MEDKNIPMQAKGLGWRVSLSIICGIGCLIISYIIGISNKSTKIEEESSYTKMVSPSFAASIAD